MRHLYRQSPGLSNSLEKKTTRNPGAHPHLSSLQYDVPLTASFLVGSLCCIRFEGNCISLPIANLQQHPAQPHRQSVAVQFWGDGIQSLSHPIQPLAVASPAGARCCRPLQCNEVARTSAKLSLYRRVTQNLAPWIRRKPACPEEVMRPCFQARLLRWVWPDATSHTPAPRSRLSSYLLESGGLLSASAADDRSRYSSDTSVQSSNTYDSGG